MMKVILLFLLFLGMGDVCYSQEQKLKFEVTKSKESFLIEEGTFAVDSFDWVTFSDFGFLDSIRYELNEFYNFHIGLDTLPAAIGSITVSLDTLGNVSGFWLLIYRKDSYLYSLEKLESLVTLLSNFHVDLPDYKKPVRRVYSGREYYKWVKTFKLFDIMFLLKPSGIVTTMDGLYERQLNEMIMSTWVDKVQKEFVFYKKSGNLYVKTLNPLTGNLDDFYCVFHAGRLNIYFDKETPSMLSYKFTDDRLTLSGVVGNQKIVWELKKSKSVP